jgi:hypothetical protein
MATTRHPRSEPVEPLAEAPSPFTAESVDDGERLGNLRLEEDELAGDEEDDEDLEEEDEDAEDDQ